MHTKDSLNNIVRSPAALEETHRDGSLERTSAFIQRTVRTIEETL